MKMKIISITAVIVSIVIAGIALPYLPNEIVIHWDAQGNPDLQANKYIGVLAIPLMMIITSFIYQLFIRIGSQQPVNHSLITAITMVFYLAVQVIIILINLDILRFHVEMAGILIGIIMIIIAPPMKNVKMNGFFGVRTPWSMKNEESWRKSNQFGSNLLFVWGVFAIIASFLLPTKYVMPSILFVGLVFIVVIVYASYRFYKESI